MEYLIDALPPAAVNAALGSRRRYLHCVGRFPPSLHFWVVCHALHVPVEVDASVLESREERRILFIEED